MLFLSLLMACAAPSFAQHIVKGKVTDSAGSPIPWAGVIVKGSTLATTTDDNGEYSITLRSGKETLTVSFIGYKDAEEAVEGRTQVNFVLEEATEYLDNAVVIGYGAVRRKDLTGAVSSIKSESITDRVMFSVDDALKGGVAGLMVSSTSGRPGAATKMLIRGANSLSGSTSPLVVVDGFPLSGVSTNTGLGMSNLDAQMSALSMINTEDIESIEVLKDASATAIYGNRGSNGVILITTKKGRGSNGKIQYSGYLSAQQLPHKYELLDLQGYAQYMHEKAPTNKMFTDDDKNARVFDPRTPSIDWQDELYRTGFIQNHNLSMQHSTDKTNFLVSGSYMQNASIIKNTNWQKINAKVSIDHNFTQKMRVGVDVTFNNVIDDGVPTSGGEGSAMGTVLGALLAPPFILDEETQGYFRRAGVAQYQMNSYLENFKENPLKMSEIIKMHRNMKRTILHSYAQYDILPELVLRSTFGLDSYNMEDNQFYPSESPRGFLYDGQAEMGYVNSGNWVNENTISWNPVFGQHRINAVAGVTESGGHYAYSSVEASSFENEVLGYHNIAMAKDFKGHSNTSHSAYMSFISRVNYSYADKYIATATFRRDGTSAFIKNKWGNFFSGALAWNANEEEFIKDIPAISNLRVRLSAGEVGNAGVPTTGSYAQLHTNGYAFGTDVSIGQYPASLANEDLTWEKTLEYNLGLELGLLNDRFSFNLDFYDKTTRDLLLEAPIINISGYSKAWQNIGRLNNHGVEFSMNAQLVDKRNFKWNVAANASRNFSKILELGQGGDPIYLGITCVGGNNAVILREGGSIGEIYGYRAIGVYTLEDFNSYYDPVLERDMYTLKPGVPSQGAGEQPGSIKLWDKEADGKINDLDKEVIGNFLPKVFGSFSTTLTLKSFDLYLGFQYSLGNQIYNANYSQIASYTGMTQNQTAMWLDRWTIDNQDSKYYASIPSRLVSSAFVEDASYLRFQTARLSYNVPSRILRTLPHIESLRVYVSGDNLYLFTRYSGYDPEVGIAQNNASSILSQGFDCGNFPQARTVTAGVNISFR